jgi:hypothetical protein
VVGGTFLGTTCHFFFWTTTNGEKKVVGGTENKVAGGTFLGTTYHFVFCRLWWSSLEGTSLHLFGVQIRPLQGMFVVVAEDIPAPQIGAEMSSATTTNAEKKVVRVTFLGAPYNFFF